MQSLQYSQDKKCKEVWINYGLIHDGKYSGFERSANFTALLIYSSIFHAVVLEGINLQRIRKHEVSTLHGVKIGTIVRNKKIYIFLEGWRVLVLQHTFQIQSTTLTERIRILNTLFSILLKSRILVLSNVSIWKVSSTTEWQQYLKSIIDNIQLISQTFCHLHSFF